MQYEYFHEFQKPFIITKGLHAVQLLQLIPQFGYVALQHIPALAEVAVFVKNEDNEEFVVDRPDYDSRKTSSY